MQAARLPFSRTIASAGNNRLTRMASKQHTTAASASGRALRDRVLSINDGPVIARRCDANADPCPFLRCHALDVARLCNRSEHLRCVYLVSGYDLLFAVVANLVSLRRQAFLGRRAIWPWTHMFEVPSGDHVGAVELGRALNAR